MCLSLRVERCKKSSFVPSDRPAGYAAHPKPAEDLVVDGEFVDTWGKFASKVKFASTFKVGPAYPRMEVPCQIRYR